MIRFLKHSVLYAIVVSLLYVLFIMLWGSFLSIDLNTNMVFKQRGGHLHTRISEIPNYRNIDILFVGSSHAYRGFDPRIFDKAGLSSFNLGSSSQAPVQSLVLLKKYLNHIQPKCVVFEICPQVFSSDGVESSLDIISNDTIDWHSTKMVFEINNFKTYNTFIYSAVRQYFKLDKNFIEEKTIGKDTYISGGYVQRKEQAFDGSHDTIKYEIKEEQWYAFVEVIELLKNEGIVVVLVQAPVSSFEYSKFNNHSLFDSTMSSYTRYYNFNTILNLDDSLHFYDSHHLNQKGVEIFNNTLIELLVY